MRLEHLLRYKEYLNGSPVNDAIIRNMNKLYNLHLKCPKCKKDIEICESVRINPDMQGIDFIIYSPEQ